MGVISLSVTPNVYANGCYVISGGDDASIRVHEINTGEMSAVVSKAHKNRVFKVCCAPNGMFIVTCDWSEKNFKVWSAPGLELVQEVGSFKRDVSAVCIDPISSTVAVGDWSGIVSIWAKKEEGKKYECIKMVTGFSNLIYAVVFSPNNKMLAASSYSDKVVKVYDVGNDYSPLHTLEDESWVCSLSFSPKDSAHLCSGSADKSIKLWNTKRGHLIRR